MYELISGWAGGLLFGNGFPLPYLGTRLVGMA